MKEKLEHNKLVVAFGCLGAVLHLDPENVNRFNGSSQFPPVLKILLKSPNVKHVILHCCVSDKSKKYLVELDPENKIIYPTDTVQKIAEVAWKDKKFYSDRQPYGCEEIPCYRSRSYCDLYAKYSIEKLPKADIGFFFIAQSLCDTNIPHTLPLKTREGWKLQLPATHKTVSPFLHYLNLSGLPWYILSTDDRMITKQYREDCMNLPAGILGQWNHQYKWMTMPSYEEAAKRVERTLIVKYAEVEKLNLIGLREDDLKDPNSFRSNKLSLVSNQTTCSNDPSCQRYKELKKWILDQDTDQEVNIIGMWDNSFLCDYKASDHKALQLFNKRKDIKTEEIVYPQFKGRKKPAEVDKLFANTRYSLCLPVIQGYCTWKWWECLVQGCLPFIPPFYDEQFNAIPEDSPLRVKSPEHMFKKIAFFDEHPDARCKVIYYYQQLIRTYMSGSFMKDQMSLCLEEQGLTGL